MDISGAPLRTLRAAVFTALCVTLSAASHVLLSGVPLPLGTVAAVCAAVFALSYALAGRERGLGAIAALLVPLELAADTVFTTGQHTCYGTAGGPVTGPLRSVGVHLLCGGGDLGTPLARVAGQPGGAPAAGGAPALPWLLLAAHVAVGLAAAVWLRRGETALGRLLVAAAGAAFAPLLVAVAAAGGRVRPRPVPVRPAGRPGTAHVDRMILHSVLRRGPPWSARPCLVQG